MYDRNADIDSCLTIVGFECGIVALRLEPDENRNVRRRVHEATL